MILLSSFIRYTVVVIFVFWKTNLEVKHEAQNFVTFKNFFAINNKTFSISKIINLRCEIKELALKFNAN